jgi:4-hydroxy-tetrahydrodipicolinate reductase
MISVCISGARGRMGSMLIDLVRQAADLELASVLERPGHPDLGKDLGEGIVLGDQARPAIQAAEVVLDFSLPQAVIEHLAIAVDLGKPVVSGTTGFSERDLEAIDSAAGSIPVVFASNMSRGIHLLNRLVATAAESLPGYDPEIFEIHHHNKADSPSGTALQLADTITAAGQASRNLYGRKGIRESGEIGISAARGGDVVGEHQVMFLGHGEQVILTHRATTREHFCRGALAAIRFVVGRKPGRYGMADVF